MPAPLEIIAVPFIVYAAPVGESFPLLDAVPGGNWVKIGTNGDLSYPDSGVTIVHEQSVNLIRVLGDTGPIKAFRTEETLRIQFTILDVSLEQYRYALNFNTITDTPAVPATSVGFRKIGLGRGPNPAQRALLVRGEKGSPYLDEQPAQYEIPRASEIGSPSVIMQKGTPIGLALEWVALVDPNAASDDERFGVLRQMDEAS